MNPFQKNKVDMSALSEEEQKAFRMYGKLPNRKDVMQNKLKERKYFDSGDYALSKAGKTSEISPTDVGREHPVPENIPHLSQSPASASGTPHPGPSGGGGAAAGAGTTAAGGAAHHGSFSGGQSSGSPVKESSFLQRGESIDDQPGPESAVADEGEGSVSPPPKRQGVPVPVRGRGYPAPESLR